MFTGIVEHIGLIAELEASTAGRRVTVANAAMSRAVAAGDSVSINGVCLTVESADDQHMIFTAVGETVQRTTVADLR